VGKIAAVQQILFEVTHCPENYETLTYRKNSTGKAITNIAMSILWQILHLPPTKSQKPSIRNSAITD